MKLSHSLMGLVFAIGMPVLSSANTLTWNFLNDVPNNSSGVAVNSPHVFADQQNDGTTITASVGWWDFDPTVYKLFEKNGGTDEKGLGLYGTNDNEIDFTHSVVLDLSQLLKNNPTPISISFSSLTGDDTGYLSYNGLYGTSVNNEMAQSLNLTDLKKSNGILDVSADCGNVLIGNVTANDPACAPEPASVGFMALAGLGATAFGLKRKKAAK